MNGPAMVPVLTRDPARTRTPHLLTSGQPWLAVLVVAAIAAACAAWPAGMAVAVVLLGAGPHNWCEARYLLSRMPARWGPLRTYFLTAIAGVVILTTAFVALAIHPTNQGAGDADVMLVWLAVWHTALITWVAALAVLRQRQAPRRDFQWLLPIGLLCLAAAWAVPLWASVALVYLHPLLALVFLERELAVRRQPWLSSYRTALALLPFAIWVLWLTAPSLDAAPLSSRPEAIQAGAFLLPDGVAGFVLATHVFLESLHYLVWIVAIPLATAAVPWDLRRVPLAARSASWRRVLAFVIAAGLVCVAMLWMAFAIDYETTRQAYFTVAIAHVLAEVPFLLRLL
jgi:hypothetical protein